MKKLFLALLMISAFAVFAGAPQFPTVWKAKVPFTPTIHKFTHNGDLSLILCSTKKQIYMMDGKTGQKLWDIEINDKLGVKNCEFQYWSQDAGVIVVFADDKRKSNSQKFFINDRTGVLLWKSDKYVADKGDYNLKGGLGYYYDYNNKTLLLCTDESIETVKAATGEVVWKKKYNMEGREKFFDCYYMKYYNLINVQTGRDEEMYVNCETGHEVTNIDDYFDFQKYIGDRSNTRSLIDIPEKNMYVTLQFKRSLFFSIPKRKMNVIAYQKGTNKMLWTTQVICDYTYDLYSTYTGAYTPVVDIAYSDNKISVAYEGLSVLDVNNGKILWQTEFQITDNDGGMGGKVEQVVYAAPFPVFNDGKAYVYVKKERKLKCFNATTGQLIWESEKSKRTDYIDGLYVYDDVVVVQLGGVALVNTKITVRSGDYTYITYSRGYQLKGEYGMYAFNKNDGKVVWSHKTIKKQTKDAFSVIYGSYFFNNQLYVTTNKNTMCLNPKNGDKIWETPLKMLKAGALIRTHFFKDKNVMVFDCKSGVAKVDASNGKVLNTIKTKVVNEPNPAIGDDSYSDYFVYTSGKSPKLKAFASLDLEKGKVNGVMKIWDQKSNLEDFFSNDGEYFIVPKGATCSLFKVKP